MHVTKKHALIYHAWYNYPKISSQDYEVLAAIRSYFFADFGKCAVHEVPSTSSEKSYGMTVLLEAKQNEMKDFEPPIIQEKQAKGGLRAKYNYN